jgi:hypothetical protein
MHQKVGAVSREIPLSVNMDHSDDTAAADGHHEIKMTIMMRNAAMHGALDVITFRSFARAVHALRAQRRFDKALAKMVNVNGAIARSLIDARLIDVER